METSAPLLAEDDPHAPNQIRLTVRLSPALHRLLVERATIGDRPVNSEIKRLIRWGLQAAEAGTPDHS